MVLGPFAETKGPRLPGRNPATQIAYWKPYGRVARPMVLVGIGVKPDSLSGLIVNHMPYRSPSTFNVGDADDFLGCGVESHEAVRV
jgi:hypothetical protein